MEYWLGSGLELNFQFHSLKVRAPDSNSSQKYFQKFMIYNKDKTEPHPHGSPSSSNSKTNKSLCTFCQGDNSENAAISGSRHSSVENKSRKFLPCQQYSRVLLH